MTAWLILAGLLVCRGAVLAARVWRAVPRCNSDFGWPQ